MLHQYPQHNFKALMSIADFNRRLQKAIAKRAEGAVNYALENFYIGKDAILSLHETVNTTSKELP